MEQGDDVHQEKERAEEDLGDMVVKVPGKRPEEVLAAYERDEESPEKTCFPVPDRSCEQEHDRHHEGSKNWRDPQRGSNNLRPGGCSCEKAEGGAYPDKHRPPRHGLAGREEGHCLEPAIMGEIVHDLIDLAKVVQGIVASHDIQDVRVQVQKRQNADPEGEDGEDEEN